MKEFTLYWLNGGRDLIKGYDITDAFRRAGYGNGSLAALDFYADGNDTSYEWKEIPEHEKMYSKRKMKWEKIN